MLQKLLSEPASSPTKRIKVVHCSRTPATILLKDSLDAIASRHRDNFAVDYMVDTGDDSSPRGAAQGLHVGRLDAKELRKRIGRCAGDGKRVVVVCGPEPFVFRSPRAIANRLTYHSHRMVEAVAGPRARDGSQGEVGGVLRTLGYTREQVVKL